MNRRGFLAAGLAASFGGVLTAHSRVREAPCGARRRAPPSGRKNGRDRRPLPYVADLGGRKVAQPILWARRGEHFDALIENALPQPTTVHFHGLTAAGSAGRSGLRPDRRRRPQARALRGQEPLRTVLVPSPSARVHRRAGARRARRPAGGHRRGRRRARFRARHRARQSPCARDRGRPLRRRRNPRLRARRRDCLHGWLGNRALASTDSTRTGWSPRAGCGFRSSTPAMRAACCSLSAMEIPLVPFHLLGTDGGLLAAPRELERVFLYSAERVDIAIDVSRAARTAGGQPGIRSAPSRAGRGVPPSSSCAGALCAARGRNGLRDRSPARTRERLPDGRRWRSSRCASRGSQRAPRLCQGASRRLREASVPPDTPTRRMRLDFDEGGRIPDRPDTLQGRRDRLQREARHARSVGDQEQPDLDAASDAPARLRLPRAAPGRGPSAGRGGSPPSRAGASPPTSASRTPCSHGRTRRSGSRSTSPCRRSRRSAVGNASCSIATTSSTRTA